MRNQLPQISEAEFEVMAIIWNHAPINTNDIVEQLAKQKAWSPKTIQTMLSRLEKKGVITHEKEGRMFVYSPLVQKEQYQTAAGHAFVNRFFDGAFGKMVLRYLDQTELSAADLDDLQAILDQKRNQRQS